MKVQRVDLFSFPKEQQYGVQQAFTDGLKRGFESIGVKSSIYPYKELGQGKIIQELVANRPDLTAGFNVTVAKHSPLEPLGLSHLSMIIDSVAYFPELLQNPHTIASFVDEDSLGFYKMLGGKYAFFLPHAVDKSMLEKDIGKKRDLDIVLTASYIDADEIIATWKHLLSPENVNRLVDIAERVLASDRLSYLQAFVELVEEKGAFEQELLEKEIPFFDILTSLDVYIRGMDRVRLLSEIDRQVHVFGKHAERWQKFNNVKYCGEVPYKALDDVLLRAKIVINSFPMFKRGLHERILISLACGASVLGNDSISMQNTFSDSLAYIPYLSPYESVNAAIEKTLQDEDARIQSVSATHSIIKNSHTWDERARYLCDVLPALLDEIKIQSEIGGIAHFFSGDV